MTMIGVTQAKAQLSALVERAAAGEKIVITKYGKPVAKLTALEPAQKPRHLKREFGFWEQHGLKLPDNFNDPDPEIEALFNDGPVFPEDEKRD